MLDFIQYIDTQLFYFINVICANPVTDYVMPFITDTKNWHIFFFIMWFAMVFNGGKRGKIAAVMIIICVIISDQTSSNLIKNLVERVRPCNALQGVHLLVNCTGSFSFPSSHAVNHFAGAFVLSHFFREYRFAIYLGATLMGLSRIFVGVHYPFDVLGGMIIGTFIGFILIYLWKYLNKYLKIDYQKKQV